MAKVAVLYRGASIIGVMRGDYTLLPDWMEEEDIGQFVPQTPSLPTKRVVTLKNTVTLTTTSFEVVKDEQVPI